MIRRRQSLLCYLSGLILLYIPIAWAEIHDPTKPVIGPEVYAATVTGSYNLESIIIGPMRRLASINGQMVGPGSIVQGARVLAIGKNHVVLFYGGRRTTLFLFGGKLWKAH